MNFLSEEYLQLYENTFTIVNKVWPQGLNYLEGKVKEVKIN